MIIFPFASKSFCIVYLKDTDITKKQFGYSQQIFHSQNKGSQKLVYVFPWPIPFSVFRKMPSHIPLSLKILNMTKLQGTIMIIFPFASKSFCIVYLKDTDITKKQFGYSQQIFHSQNKGSQKLVYVFPWPIPFPVLEKCPHTFPEMDCKSTQTRPSEPRWRQEHIR